MPAPEERIDPGDFLRREVAPRVRRRIEELRASITRLQAELDDRLAADATIELRLEGDGGGVWYLVLHGGEMTVADRATSAPLVRVYQSRTDWEALARASGARPPSGGDLTRSRVERLRGIDGAIEFRLTDEEGERTVVVQFGPGERSAPRCTVVMRADDARRLQTGELTPQAAFMQGLVKLQGDAAFAMQVGAALLL
jgi:putative sterol carrier protein